MSKNSSKRRSTKAMLKKFLPLIIIMIIASSFSIYYIYRSYNPKIIDTNDLDTLISLSIESFDKGDYSTTVEYLDMAIALSPKDISLHFNRGLCLDQLSHFEEAVSSYDKVIELDPKDIDAYSNKALSLDHVGKFEDAIDVYSEIIKLDPTNTEFYNNKGISLANLERYDEALECFNQALTINPDDQDSSYNRQKALSIINQQNIEKLNK